MFSTRTRNKAERRATELLSAIRLVSQVSDSPANTGVLTYLYAELTDVRLKLESKRRASIRVWDLTDQLSGYIAVGGLVCLLAVMLHGGI